MKTAAIALLICLSAVIFEESRAQKLQSANLLNKEKPLFIENKGQVADQNGNLRPDVKFIYALGNYKFILRKNGFSLSVVFGFKPLCSFRPYILLSRQPENYIPL